MPFHFQPFISQIAPTLATLPNFSAELTKAAPSTVVLKYAPPDFVNQVRPDLATIPGGASTGLSPESRVSNPPVFIRGEVFSSPTRFGLTQAAVPTTDSWTSTLGQKSLPVNYAPTDYVKPTATVGFVQPAFSWMPPLSLYSGFKKSYARTVADTGVNVDAAVITLIHWTPNIGPNAIVLKYAQSDIFSAPTLFNLIVAATVFIPSRHSDAQPIYIGTFASTDFVSQIAPPLPTTIGVVWSPTTGIFTNNLAYSRVAACIGFSLQQSLIINVAGWEDTEGKNAVILNYADGDILTAPDKFGQIVVSIPTVDSWTSTIGQNAAISKTVQCDYVNQISPTLILTSLGFLPYIIISAQPQNFTTTNFVAPDKFSLTQSFISHWTPTLGVSSVILRYAPSDYVNQVRPTLATLPVLLSGISEPGVNAQPEKYAQPSYESPAKFNLVIPSSPITVASWSSTTGSSAIVLRYAPSDYVNQIKPTLATLPVLLSDITFVASNAQPQKFSATDWTSPAKFNIIVAATPTVDSWTSTIGQGSIVLNYATSSYVAPDKIIPLAAVPVYSWRGEDGYFPKFDWYSMGDTSTGPSNVAGIHQAYSSAIEAQNALVFRYASTSWTAPEKFGQTVSAPITIAGWTSTTGQGAIILNYALPAWDAPSKFGLVQAVVSTISSWTATIGLSAVALKYAPSDYVNQIKPTLATLPNGVATDYTVWNRVGNPVPFQQGDTFTSPAKFGIIAQAAITISNWTPTIGQKSVILNYAPPDYVNQIRPTLATLPNGISTDFTVWNRSGNPPIFQQGDTWSAPAKFGIIVPATPTIESWSSTDGQKAIVLRYAPSDYVNQVRPTLATLPVLLSGISEPGINAQPQKFVASLFDAPSKFNLPFISVSGWFGTDGQKAIVLNYAPTAWDAPAKFGILAIAIPTIESWTSTDGQRAVTLRYAPTDYVNQIAPTLAALSLGTSFLAFVPPNAQPQLFAPTTYVNQVSPTLQALPTGFATDFTVFARRANPPTFSLGDIFTGPPTFNLPFIPGSILVKGVVFYKVVTSYNVIVNGVVTKIVLVQ